MSLVPSVAAMLCAAIHLAPNEASRQTGNASRSESYEAPAGEPAEAPKSEPGEGPESEPGEAPGSEPGDTPAEPDGPPTQPEPELTPQAEPDLEPIEAPQAEPDLEPIEAPQAEPDLEPIEAPDDAASTPAETGKLDEATPESKDVPQPSTATEVERPSLPPLTRVAPAPLDRRHPTERFLLGGGIASMGVAVGLAVPAIVGAVALSERPPAAGEMDETFIADSGLSRDGWRQLTIGTGVAAGVFGLTGFTLVALSLSGRTDARQARVSLTPTGRGVLLRGRF